MCYFITVGLPEKKAAILEANLPRGLHTAGTANRSVLAQMGDGIRTFLLMSGGCSCSLFCELDIEAESKSTQERRRHKYEKMGWSPAKIQRALGERPKGGRSEPFTGLRGDVQRLLGELALQAGQLAILVHWYDEDLEEGRITCKRGEHVPPETLLAEQLHIAPDELVLVKVRP